MGCYKTSLLVIDWPFQTPCEPRGDSQVNFCPDNLGQNSVDFCGSKYSGEATAAEKDFRLLQRGGSGTQRRTEEGGRKWCGLFSAGVNNC